MGIYVTVNLDIEPLTAELFFPLGLPAGSSIDLIVTPPPQPKVDDRKSSFSLCHAFVCGRKVPIARNNFDKSFEAASVPKGLCVRSPLVNGQRICQLKNVHKGASERPCPPSAAASTKSAASVTIPQTTLAPADSLDTVVADDPEECKNALDDIIKAGEPETKTVFVCTECPHRTFDKEEAVEHCKSHLASSGTADAASTAKAVPRFPTKRGRPPKKRFHCNTCTKSFPSKQSLQTHLLNHTSRGAAVPLVTVVKRASEAPPMNESVNCSQNPVLETTSDCPQPLSSRVLEGYADPAQNASVSGDSSISEATVFRCLGCAGRFASLSDLDAHRQSVHPDLHFCHICGEVFSEAFNLESHVSEAHGKGICFYCTLCLMVFVGEESFKDHKAQCGVACATSKRKRREFICSRCSFITDAYSKLCDHVVDKHPNVAVHQCEHCQKPFLHSAMLEHHCKTVHEKTDEQTAREKVNDKNSTTRLYPCTFCDRVFRSHRGIQAHTNVHKNLRPYECRKCGASLTSMTNLKAHMVCIHGNPGDNAKCPHCPKVFKLKRSLNIHVRAIHSQEGRRQCELCGKWLATERKLQRHIALTHYGDAVNDQDGTFSLLRPLKCDHCDFKSFSYPRLARHRVTHTGVYPHQCPECNKQFVFRDQMTRHVQTVHRKVRLTCPQCPRLFFSEKLFQQHLDVHRLGQGFPCTMCNNFYDTKAALDHHSQSHEASLPYQCELCQQRFKFSQGLSIHRRFRHSKEARSSSQWKSGDHTWRHSCDVCHIRFKYQSSLAAHRLNRHADAERLTCTYCSRNFNSQSVLALHIRSHTGEKPHVCPHCSKAFSIPHNLKNHVITQHTKEFKFFCPLCSKGAVSQIKLRQHLLQSHKAVNDSSSKYRRTVKQTVTDMPDIDGLPMSQVAVEDAASILSQIIM